MFVIVILVEKVDFRNGNLGKQFLFICSFIGASHYENNLYNYCVFLTYISTNQKMNGSPVSLKICNPFYFNLQVF